MSSNLLLNSYEAQGSRSTLVVKNVEKYRLYQTSKRRDYRVIYQSYRDQRQRQRQRQRQGVSPPKGHQEPQRSLQSSSPLHRRRASEHEGQRLHHSPAHRRPTSEEVKRSRCRLLQVERHSEAIHRKQWARAALHQGSSPRIEQWGEASRSVKSSSRGRRRPLYQHRKPSFLIIRSVTIRIL